MPESSQTKSARRRNIRDSFPSPLNQVALRNVDAIQALPEDQRMLLASAVTEEDLPLISYYLSVLKDATRLVEKDELIKKARESRGAETEKKDTGKVEHLSADQVDEKYMVDLLTSSFPDMPASSASALVLSEVMKPCLQVVTTTRLAMDDARSDFVLIVLFKLFEENLDALREAINSNPAYIKAMQLSRPDWKSNQ